MSARAMKHSKARSESAESHRLPGHFDWGLYSGASLEGDFIVPEQLPRNGNCGGERDLLMAVFEDGIRLYCEQIARGSTTSPEFREVEDWILSSDSDAVTSFVSLCELFGI